MASSTNLLLRAADRVDLRVACDIDLWSGLLHARIVAKNLLIDVRDIIQTPLLPKQWKGGKLDRMERPTPSKAISSLRGS